MYAFESPPAPLAVSFTSPVSRFRQFQLDLDFGIADAFTGVVVRYADPAFAHEHLRLRPVGAGHLHLFTAGEILPRSDSFCFSPGLATNGTA